MLASRNSLGAPIGHERGVTALGSKPIGSFNTIAAGRPWAMATPDG